MMYQYCAEKGITAERCGKLVVAVNEKEHAQVQKLFDQGNANGVKGLEIVYHDQVSIIFYSGALRLLLTPFKIKKIEPNIEAYSALWSPNTGIVDYAVVSRHLAQDILETGYVVRFLSITLLIPV